MKPKSRKSFDSDPSHVKRLSTNMKPQAKSRSNESIASRVIGRRSPIAEQLLSTAKSSNKVRCRINPDSSTTTNIGHQAPPGRSSKIMRQKASTNLIKNSTGSFSDCSVSNKSSFTSSGSILDCSLKVNSSANRPFLKNSKRRSVPSTPMTPRIMVTKCEKLERLVEEKEDGKSTRKVLRGKIKSPVNQIQRSIVERNLRSKETYEVQLKKKESEILSLNRKVNNLQKTVMEKERTIKSLELKFPKMISELKRGLMEEKKNNVELKETLKKFRQVSGDKKQMEEQMRIKDDKMKDLKSSRKLLVEELKAKETELNEFRNRLRSLEIKVPELINELSRKEEEIRSKDEDLIRYEESVDFLEQRLEAQSSDQRIQEKLIDDLKRRVNECCEEIDAKDNEILDLKASNVELYDELQEQYEALEKTDLETQNYLQIIDSIREKIDVAPVNIQKLHNSIDYLDKATEDFLDKVSSVSKKKNMSFRVKLTIKKSQKGKSVGGNDTYDSIIVNPRSFNNNISSSRLSFNNIKHSSRNSGKMSQENIFRMSQSRNSSNFNQSRYSVEDGRKSKLINLSQDFLDDVFEDNNVSQGSKKPRSSQGSVSSVNTEVSKSEYDVSSDTCMRLEELDNKVQTLWQKLSTKDEDYEKFVSNTQV